MSELSDDDPIVLSATAEAVRAAGTDAGFELVGIAPAVSPSGFPILQDWLTHGYGGEMQYMNRREGAYEHPSGVLPNVRSLIVVAMNYFSTSWKEQQNADEGELPGGRVARYAAGQADYHDVLRDRLKQVATVLHERHPDCRTRCVVDTAPLLERDFARLAGLGWFGKNTMLINKRAGSWLFLGVVLTDLQLPADAPHETAHCGTCTRCLEACPTDAFVEPYILDSRKCISYLTIELRNEPIPLDMRNGIEDWVFGCDVCQEVCPWNRKAPETPVAEFLPIAETASCDLVELLSLDEAAFEERFEMTPLSRPGRSGVLRNAVIVAGNSGDLRFVPALCDAIDDDEPLVRGAAAWALGQLLTDDALSALQRRFGIESDPQVRAEIADVLARIQRS